MECNVSIEHISIFQYLVYSKNYKINEFLRLYEKKSYFRGCKKSATTQNEGLTSIPIKISENNSKFNQSKIAELPTHIS